MKLYLKSFSLCLFLLLLGSREKAFAQKEALADLLKNTNARLTNHERLHMEYSLKVKATSGETETMTMNLYKADDKQRLVLGEVQEVVQEGRNMIVVNHIQKLITMQEDSAVPSALSLTTSLESLLDSAASISREVKGANQEFELTFKTPHVSFKKLRFVFSKKSKDLISIFQEFLPDDPQGYAEVEIQYLQWDASWKPDTGFPHMEKFVLVSANGAILQESWKGYKFFKPERGQLKF